jgi:hypothetical protein
MRLGPGKLTLTELAAEPSHFQGRPEVGKLTLTQASRGTPSALPYLEEMEAFFGEELSDLEKRKRANRRR